MQKELAEKRGVLAFARRLVAEAQAGLISDNGSESARRKLEQARLTLVVDEANMQAAGLKVSAVEARSTPMMCGTWAMTGMPTRWPARPFGSNTRREWPWPEWNLPGPGEPLLRPGWPCPASPPMPS
ncbi:MAG: hypothetical protein Ct9H300mP1_24740 [Planctomycetaceae bacterium]|nr:MAG: hypothetical protein Ct9H300mP1_24740 [Planctomycetaceae bacterium]